MCRYKTAASPLVSRYLQGRYLTIKGRPSTYSLSLLPGRDWPAPSSSASRLHNSEQKERQEGRMSGGRTRSEDIHSTIKMTSTCMSASTKFLHMHMQASSATCTARTGSAGGSLLPLNPTEENAGGRLSLLPSSLSLPGDRSRLLSLSLIQEGMTLNSCGCYAPGSQTVQTSHT